MQSSNLVGIGERICEFDRVDYYRGLIGQDGRFLSGNFFYLLREAQKLGFNLPTIQEARDFISTHEGKKFVEQFWFKVLGILDFQEQRVVYRTCLEVLLTGDCFSKQETQVLPEEQARCLRTNGRIEDYLYNGLPFQVDSLDMLSPPQYRCVPKGQRVLGIGGGFEKTTVYLSATSSLSHTDQKFPLLVKKR